PRQSPRHRGSSFTGEGGPSSRRDAQPMTATAPTPEAPARVEGDGTAWHTVSVDQLFSLQGVDEHQGLTTAEAAKRREQSGPNRLAAAKTEARGPAFLRQDAD